MIFSKLSDMSEKEIVSDLIRIYVASNTFDDVLTKITRARNELQGLILTGAITPDSQLEFRGQCFGNIRSVDYEKVKLYFTKVANFYTWTMGCLFTKVDKLQITPWLVKTHEAQAGLTKLVTEKYIKTLSDRINMLTVNETVCYPEISLFDDTRDTWLDYVTFAGVLTTQYPYLTSYEQQAATYLYKLSQNWGTRRTDTEWLYEQLVERHIRMTEDGEANFTWYTCNLVEFWNLTTTDVNLLAKKCLDSVTTGSFDILPLIILSTEMRSFQFKCSMKWESNDDCYIKYIDVNRKLLVELRLQPCPTGIIAAVVEMSMINPLTEVAIGIVDEETKRTACTAITQDLNKKLKSFGAHRLIFISNDRLTLDQGEIQ